MEPMLTLEAPREGYVLIVTPDGTAANVSIDLLRDPVGLAGALELYGIVPARSE